MQPDRDSIVVLAVLALLAAGAVPASAQCFPYPMPWPDGCSVQLPLFIQNGIDEIFFGACTRHDLCYAQPNPNFGPCLGYGWKAQCDFTLAAEMEAACTFYTSVLSFPGSGWVDAQDFFGDCTYVAGVFYGAVSALGFPAFQSRQCCLGCNADLCGGGLTLPFFCEFGGVCGSGGGGGPGCNGGYVNTETLVVNLDSGEVQQFDPVSSAGLTRVVEIDGKFYFEEEWVLTEIDRRGRTSLVASSSPRASEELELEASIREPSAGGSPRFGDYLVVESARHFDGRMPPLVRLNSLVTGIQPAGPLADGRVTFRAGFDPQAILDSVETLEGDPATANALATDLRVEFPFVDPHGEHDGHGEESHRSVVFATFHVKRGKPDLVSVIPVLPQCCCGDVWCP